MANKLLDRVQMSVSGTPGTGSVTLGAALANYLSFAAAGATDATQYSYCIVDGVNWEMGVGTYTAAGTTFSRDTVYITSAGNQTKISFTSSAIIGCVATAEDFAAASASEFLLGTVSKFLNAANVWSAVAEYNAGNTGATTVTLDMSHSPNQFLTANGNFTIAALTNVRVGMTGTIRVQQDGTGSRTITWDTSFKTAGGTVGALSTTANAYDDIDYKVEAVTGTTATRVRYNLSKDVK